MSSTRMSAQRAVAARSRVSSLTMGDGSMALAAMFLGKPFVGVCLTDEHANGVRNHLANVVFKGFFTEGSPFHDARIAEELAEAGLSKAHADEAIAASATAVEAAAKAAKAAAKAKTPKSGGGGTKKRPLNGGGDGNNNEADGNIAKKMKAALAALGGSGEGGNDDEEDEEEIDED